MFVDLFKALEETLPRARTGLIRATAMAALGLIAALVWARVIPASPSWYWLAPATLSAALYALAGVAGRRLGSDPAEAVRRDVGVDPVVLIEDAKVAPAVQ